MSDWGDDAPILQKPKTSAAAKPAGSWGDDAPAVTKPAGGKKTSHMLGVLEPIYDVARKAAPYSPANLIPGFREQNEASIERLGENIERRQQTEKPSLLTKTVAGLELTAPMMLATRNPLLLGAGQGAALSEADDAVGVGLDAAGGALLNKAAGAATDKLADALKPAVAPAVALMQKAGVRLTPGQIKGGKALASEDKAMSRPIVGDRISADRVQFRDDVNRGAVNEALFPLGVRLPDNIATGHDAVAFMQETAGKAYDKILPNLKLQADQRLAVGVRNGWKAAQDLSEDGQKRFTQLLQNKLRFSPSGELTGRQLSVAMRDLRDLAAGFQKGSTEDERILGEALGSVHEGLQASLSAQNPGYAKALTAANEAYKGNLVVSRAAAGADEGISTTGQLKTASRAVDRSKAKRATAAGKGPMQGYVTAARQVTGKTPDSGTAGRLLDGNWIARARGAVDAGLYEADKAMTGLRTAPRPAQAEKVASFLRDHRREIAVAGGPVIGGLLAGLLGSE
jgi:hypothetical protein